MTTPLPYIPAHILAMNMLGSQDLGIRDIAHIRMLDKDALCATRGMLEEGRLENAMKVECPTLVPFVRSTVLASVCKRSDIDLYNFVCVVKGMEALRKTYTRCSLKLTARIDALIRTFPLFETHEHRRFQNYADTMRLLYSFNEWVKEHLLKQHRDTGRRRRPSQTYGIAFRAVSVGYILRFARAWPSDEFHEKVSLRFKQACLKTVRNIERELSLLPHFHRHPHLAKLHVDNLELVDELQMGVTQLLTKA